MTSSSDAPTPPTRLPRFRSRAEYAASLGDASFWRPYVEIVLRRHGLPLARSEIGTVGTFPTFLVGDLVVKLFLPTLAKPLGTLFSGTRCHQVEVEVLRALAEQPSIPSPALVAEGYLAEGSPDEDSLPERLLTDGYLPESYLSESYPPDDASISEPAEPPWPYLVMRRLRGTSWARAELPAQARRTVAHELGVVVRRVHALAPPAGPPWAPDWIAEYRRGCVERQRGWGTLPPHLIDQIADYLWTPPADRCLVHADLHADHLLVDGRHLVGILDWGDAIVADPYYELPALYLHTFDADLTLLDAFLAGYGWPADPDFVRRAMSMTLLREFDVLDNVARRIDLQTVASLEVLAEMVWGSPALRLVP